MPRLDAVTRLLDDETWRFAVAFGLASVPFTTYAYWRSAHHLDLVPVFLCGLFAGYLYAGPPSSARRVGARTGLVGALPALWLGYDALSMALTIENPAWFTVVLVVFSVGLVVVAVGLSAFLGAAGAVVGDRLSARTGRRPASTGS